MHTTKLKESFHLKSADITIKRASLEVTGAPATFMMKKRLNFSR
jgi:hypothetical protein